MNILIEAKGYYKDFNEVADHTTTLFHADSNVQIIKSRDG